MKLMDGETTEITLRFFGRKSETKQLTYVR